MNTLNSRRQTTWAEVLSQMDLIGCMIETRVGRNVDMGLLTMAWQEGNHVHLMVPCIFCLDQENQRWHYVGATSWDLDKDQSPPYQTEDGGLWFCLGSSLDCKIFPKNLRSFDGSKVVGQPPDLERSLSLRLLHLMDGKASATSAAGEVMCLAPLPAGVVLSA